jgi:hypothetical protein
LFLFIGLAYLFRYVARRNAGNPRFAANRKDRQINKEIIAEIVKRLKKAFATEKKVRKEWVKIGLPESTAPSAIGLIGDEQTGYECTRYYWWRALGCEGLADGLDYFDTAHEVEKTKIKGLSFGS